MVTHGRFSCGPQLLAAAFLHVNEDHVPAGRRSLISASDGDKSAMSTLEGSDAMFRIQPSLREDDILDVFLRFATPQHSSDGKYALQSAIVGAACFGHNDVSTARGATIREFASTFPRYLRTLPKAPSSPQQKPSLNTLQFQRLCFAIGLDKYFSKTTLDLIFVQSCTGPSRRLSFDDFRSAALRRLAADMRITQNLLEESLLSSLQDFSLSTSASHRYE
mmetsp:Transcript_57364/g.124649  ORF Transcript_57364/g.124649 Transcript_57364/m.124649 type:complete len:220 (+) Transcript_57364:111-770(+)|eukprot:6203785-Pleurochrysis_carterae.AAC.2